MTDARFMETLASLQPSVTALWFGFLWVAGMALLHGLWRLPRRR